MPPAPPLSLASPRYETDAPIVAHDRTLDNAFELTFHAPAVAQAARPGQFLELRFGDSYAPLLRRPFSLYAVDRPAGTVTILYRAHGAFTSGLTHLRPGDVGSLLGPLGRPFTWTAAPQTRSLLIAGGIGAPPLCFLATELCRDSAASEADTHKIVVINAARSADLLIGMTTFESLNIDLVTVTDDGSHGRRGLAPELLVGLLDAEPTVPTQLFACGPMPMLRAVSEIAVARSIPAQISVETAMPCGIGTCWGCAVPIRDTSAPSGFVYARACTEGPVFEAQTLLWET